MNIFVTDPSPYKSARYLDNTRLVKMTLETAQLLSGAIILNGGSATYKLSHKGHPAMKWVSSTKGNYKWLYKHFLGLLAEYKIRSSKEHSCKRLINELRDGINYIPDGELQPHVNCAANNEKGVSFKHIPCVYTAYRLYLQERWKFDKRPPKWKFN